MNRIGRATVMLALGGITARLLLNGGFGWFVQQRMRLPLWGATIVLLVFGAYELWMGSRDERRNPESSRWPVGPRVGWLMILPLVVLISVAPTGLGAAAAGRVDAYTPENTTDAFEPLDTSDGPVEMRVFDFLDRENLPADYDLTDPAVQAKFPDIPEYMGKNPPNMGPGISREAPRHY